MPEDKSTGAELRLCVLLDLLLDVDLRDGSLDLDLEDWRSGTTTTGMPPLFHTSRLAFLLATELIVVMEA